MEELDMEKKEQLYEGKAKKVFATDDANLVIVDYKDDATAFNGEKKGTITGKGVINNVMSNHMFQLLEQQGVPTHFVEQLSERETLVKKSPLFRWRSSSATFPPVPLQSVSAWKRASYSTSRPSSSPTKTMSLATRS